MVFKVEEESKQWSLENNASNDPDH